MKKIQQSKKFKIIDKSKLLMLQNETRLKYGLKSHKRIDLETILYLIKDEGKKTKINITQRDGGMYQ
jgi:hypothetical protein